MPGAVLLNPDDPNFAFEHMMQHRQYFAVIRPLPHFSVIPYLLDPAQDTNRPAWNWNKNHQQAHDDFNADLPSNFNDGYTLTVVTPTPPPDPPPPSYLQAHPTIDAGTFGINQPGILIEGEGDAPGSREWWTFVNHQQHLTANNAILPLPTTAPTTAGTGPGTLPASNPWWWVERAPVNFPFW